MIRKGYLFEKLLNDGRREYVHSVMKNRANLSKKSYGLYLNLFVEKGAYKNIWFRLMIMEELFYLPKLP